MKDKKLLVALKNFANQMDLQLNDETAEKAIAYLVLMHQWNKVYNLTGIPTPQKMVPYHLLDSFAAQPFLSGHTILDLGTGAGLPGIPLCLLFPEKQFILLDKSAKKTRFLMEAKAQLGLTNIEIVCARAEAYTPNKVIDLVIFRAHGPLITSLKRAASLTHKNGQIIAMLGDLEENTLNSLPQGIKCLKINPYEVPTIPKTRHIVQFQLT